MFNAEPPRSAYDLNFALFGFPIRICPWFWLASLLMGSRLKDPASMAIWIAAVFVSIFVHELGHAVVARAYGFRPWITLHGFGGLTSYEPRAGYLSRPLGALGEVLISLAGPLAGFLLAGLLLAAVAMAGQGAAIERTEPLGLTPWVTLPNLRLAEFLNRVFFISVTWGLVNLLPVYPLDGGQISREIFLKLNPRDGIRQSLLLSIIAAIAMAAYGWEHWHHDLFIVLLFGCLAYSSYSALVAYSDQRPW